LRATILVWAGVLLAIGGCAAPDKQRDAEFQLHTAEEERDALRQQLGSERARSAALQKRAEADEVDLSATRAEVGAQREQVERLSQRIKELQAPLEQMKSRELTRPAVPASPLPPKTDETLQALAEKFGDRVWYDRGRGAVSFANDRLFDPGSDVVRADAHAALRELASALAASELAEYEIIVVGHTDALPISKPETLAQHPTNWHLSVHRAIAVKDVLVKGGLPAARLGVMGYADNRPIGNDPARNRRVEVFIVREGGVQAFQPVLPGSARK